MTEIQTFPCPGCGAQLVVIPAYGLMEADETPVPAFPVSAAGQILGIERYHTVFSTSCTARALVAAVRSLDAGLRDAAQLRVTRDAVFDERFDRALTIFQQATAAMGAPLPTMDDFRDRDPLIGNVCVHGVRVDAPCGKCDDITTFCPPPCGARHDQGPMGHKPDCEFIRARYVDGVFRAGITPDTDPVYGPCGVCLGNHATEDHEAVPECAARFQSSGAPGVSLICTLPAGHKGGHVGKREGGAW